MPGYVAEKEFEFRYTPASTPATINEVYFKATIKVNVNDDYTEATFTISNAEYNVTPGEITGLGFCDIMGICWYLPAVEGESAEFAVADDTPDSAWQQLFDSIPRLEENLIYGACYQDSAGDQSGVSERTGTFSKTLDVSPGENIWVCNTFVRYAKSEDDGSARPPDQTIAVMAVNDSWNIRIDDLLDDNYYPFAVYQDGRWLSCNREGGSVRRWDGAKWIETTNSLTNDDNDHVHYYADGTWNKAPLIGEE